MLMMHSLAEAGVAVHAINPLFMIPFALILMAIALMPFINAHWWEHHYPKVSIGLGAVTVAYYIFGLGDGRTVLHTGIEYISFLALVASLFVVSGGIHVRVKGEATPVINCLFLFVGAILANFIGTTGASMVMIRPWIRMNKYRITSFHIIFFIFIVSNCGGCLTPIGDPPLFLGYLKGVPFFWVLQHCWPAWLCVIAGLIGIFYLFDRTNYQRAPKDIRDKETAHETWSIRGGFNILLIFVIIGAVFIPVPFVREALMVGVILLSSRFTPKPIHEANNFNFAPIREVGFLFLGIFATMMPVLDYLKGNAKSLGLQTELQFYYAAGLFSSFLDNAPTYLTFLTAQMALDGWDINNKSHVADFVIQHPANVVAVSLGAVFFGAMTYIGNAPNFMVKTIAEHEKIRMPSFFGYVFKYAIPFLLPLLAIVGWLFFVERFFN